MQCLIRRKPRVHANPIVEKEERNQQKARTLSKTSAPRLAQPKNVPSSETISAPDLSGQLPDPL